MCAAVCCGLADLQRTFSAPTGRHLFKVLFYYATSYYVPCDNQLGGAPMADVRAVAVLAAGAAGAQGLLLFHVLLAAVRARAGVRAAHPAAAAHDAETFAAACALVAVRSGAAADGARGYGAPVDLGQRRRLVSGLDSRPAL